MRFFDRFCQVTLITNTLTMSDTRNDAEQEMVSAGIATGLEDSLGVSHKWYRHPGGWNLTYILQSSLSGSFAPPSMKPKPAPAPSAAAEVAKAQEAEEDASPVPGMAEWKDTYENYLKDWQAESSIARQKAEETRKKIEDEHAAKAKAAGDEVKEKKRAEAEAKKQKEREEKLKRELEQPGSSTGGVAKRKADLSKEERERKVKEAWEMVKGAGEGKQDKEVVTDARGVMDEDIKAGNVQLEGQEKEAVKPVSLGHLTPQSAVERTNESDRIRPYHLEGSASALDAGPATFPDPTDAELIADAVSSFSYVSSMDRSVGQYFFSRRPLSSSIWLVR